LGKQEKAVYAFPSPLNRKGRDGKCGGGESVIQSKMRWKKSSKGRRGSRESSIPASANDSRFGFSPCLAEAPPKIVLGAGGKNERKQHRRPSTMTSS